MSDGYKYAYTYTGIPKNLPVSNRENRKRHNYNYPASLDEIKDNREKNILVTDYIRTQEENRIPTKKDIPTSETGWYTQRNNENTMDDSRWNYEKENAINTTRPNSEKRYGPRKIIPSKHPNPRKNNEISTKNERKVIPFVPNPNPGNRAKLPTNYDPDSKVTDLNMRYNRMNQILNTDESLRNATRKNTPPGNVEIKNATRKNTPPKESKRKVINHSKATPAKLAQTRDNTANFVRKVVNRQNLINTLLNPQEPPVVSKRKTVRRQGPTPQTQVKANVENPPTRKTVRREAPPKMPLKANDGNRPNRKTVMRPKQNQENEIKNRELIQKMQIRIATVLTLNKNKNTDNATRDRLQKRINIYSKRIDIDCEYITKDIINNNDWDIFTNILMSDIFWKQLHLEFLKWNDLVITLINKIEEIHDNYNSHYTKIMQFITACINIKYRNLNNKSGLENVLNDILSYLYKAYELSTKKRSGTHEKMISMINSIEFFDEKKIKTENGKTMNIFNYESFYTDDLVNDKLTKIFKSIMLLNEKDNTLLKMSYSIIYKIIKYKYINDDADIFLEENILYNDELKLVEIKDITDENKKLKQLNKDILHYIKNKDKPSSNFSFFGLLNSFVCGNPKINIKNTSDNPIGIFISSSCSKINILYKQNSMDIMDNMLKDQDVKFIKDSYSSSEESAKNK